MTVKLITREIPRRLSQTFQWQSLYYCKFCGERGYYEIEHSENSTYCARCNHQDGFEEFHDDSTAGMLASRCKDEVEDFREWVDVVIKTEAQWEFSDMMDDALDTVVKKLEENLYSDLYSSSYTLFKGSSGGSDG